MQIMLLPLQKISDDPSSSGSTIISRKVQFTGFTDTGDSRIALHFEVHGFNSNGKEISSFRIYERHLIGDNSTPVNPDGSFSFNSDGSPNWAAGTIGEFDFICNLVNSSTALISQFVTMIQYAV